MSPAWHLKFYSSEASILILDKPNSSNQGKLMTQSLKHQQFCTT